MAFERRVGEPPGDGVAFWRSRLATIRSKLRRAEDFLERALDDVDRGPGRD